MASSTTEVSPVIVKHDAAHAGLQDRIADGITTFAGSMPFVYIHIVWFAFWIAWNVGLLGFSKFDPFPFGLLTLIVSLEAIFLATFVMISQNRQAKFANIKAQHDYESQTLELQENTEITKAIHAIVKKLGIGSV